MLSRNLEASRQVHDHIHRIFSATAEHRAGVLQHLLGAVLDFKPEAGWTLQRSGLCCAPAPKTAYRNLLDSDTNLEF